MFLNKFRTVKRDTTTERPTISNYGSTSGSKDLNPDSTRNRNSEKPDFNVFLKQESQVIKPSNMDRPVINANDYASETGKSTISISPTKPLSDMKMVSYYYITYNLYKLLLNYIIKY